MDPQNERILRKLERLQANVNYLHGIVMCLIIAIAILLYRLKNLDLLLPGPLS